MGVVLAIFAVLIALGMPSYSSWIQNSQIRTAGETILAGLQSARNQAVTLNTPVRFQFTDTLTSSCAVSASGTNWVISRNDPAAKCDGSSAADPFIIESKSGTEGTRNVAILASQAFIAFSGLGQTNAAANFTVDIKNPSSGGKCVIDGGDRRCLRIVVTPAGQVRMCDTAVSDTKDVRIC
jgi:type IV fimbrial biogenesis protein FimT